jgi:hypothetical protein
MAVSGPPTALSVNLTDASGVVTRLGPEDTNPETIPTAISFRTARDGFGDASMTLARRIDRDYIDVNLLDEVQIVGADGTIAYEGRIGAAPRTFDGQHSVGLQFAGWIAHAKDRQFTEIYVDRELARWGPKSSAYAIVHAATYASFDAQVKPDAAGGSALWTVVEGGQTGIKPWPAGVYDAGPNRIGSVYYAWARVNIASGDANYTWDVRVSTDDGFASTDTTGDLRAAGPSTGTLTATTATRRYAIVEWSYAAASAWTLPYAIVWTNLAVYGTHGLTKRGTAPQGFYASDVMADVASRFCPKLNTGGIQSTTFPIPHLVFRDLTHPYDAFLEINKYHLWDFGVWDNKTLFYKPIDLTDYDWEIRLDDHDYPATVSLQGDSTQDLANGVTVQYTNVTTGVTEILLPSAYSELLDPAVDNPFTTHGYSGWKPYQVSVPTTAEAALQLGRAALAEFNQPTAPGSITIGPHIRDRQGHPQPAWKVRAGDRVAITSSTSLSDRPRMISETTYDHDSRKVTINLDSGVKRLDAVVDRLTVALQAANLG